MIVENPSGVILQQKPNRKVQKIRLFSDVCLVTFEVAEFG